MVTLGPLGLRTGWTYEVVLCSYLEGRPHAAPVGVWTRDGRTLCLDLYESSRSLGAIVGASAFAVDFPRDVTALFTVATLPDDLRFSTAAGVAAPCLPSSSATVGLTLLSAQRRGPRTRLTGSVVSVTKRRDVRLINRGESMLLESLIIASRAHVLGRAETLARLAGNRRVAAKVAPHSGHAERIDSLVRHLESSS